MLCRVQYSIFALQINCIENEQENRPYKRKQEGESIFKESWPSQKRDDGLNAPNKSCSQTIAKASEIDPKESYSFEVITRDDGAVVYNFLTANDVGYTVLFNTAGVVGIDSCYESPITCEHGYILAFMREGRKYEDPLVFPTIDSIINDFIEKFASTDAAFFYTCDNSDGKHFARKKLFDKLVCEINADKYNGTSVTIEDQVEETSHCIGCFFLRESTVGEQILEEFDEFSISLMAKS